jgi:hypothetical protein
MRWLFNSFQKYIGLFFSIFTILNFKNSSRANGAEREGTNLPSYLHPGKRKH